MELGGIHAKLDKSCRRDTSSTCVATSPINREVSAPHDAVQPLRKDRS